MYTSTGLRAVNCGRLLDVDGLEVEVLCKETSGHLADIVVRYLDEGGRKVTVSFYRDRGRCGAEVYFFKGAAAVHHYYSRNYPELKGLPAHYADLIERLRTIHATLFAGR